jgi:hypothetical protein
VAGRDYAAEYARRIARGLAAGRSRSQARGHPGLGQGHVSTRARVPAYDRRLEEGLKAVRSGRSLRDAARSIHVAPERLRQYLDQTGVVEKQGGRLRVTDDDRVRDVPLYTAGALTTVRLPNYTEALHAGRFMAATEQFFSENDAAILAPFAGEFVTDVDGHRHPFETRPNVLYRLRLTGAAPFEQVYRIVV